MPLNRSPRATESGSSSPLMADEKKNQGFSATDSFGEFETRLKQWVAKQSFPIDAAIATVTGAVEGAITGVIMDVVFEGACSVFSLPSPSSLDPQSFPHFGGYQPLVQSIIAGSRLEQARSFAVMYAANSGIRSIMKKFRGKDDVHTSMVAGFGSGVMLSLVSGMRGPEVMSVGLMFSLLNGGFFKVQEKSSKPNAEDAWHEKTSGVFSSIGFGLDHHAMHFDNNTLSVLNDRKDVNEGGKRTWLRTTGSDAARR